MNSISIASLFVAVLASVSARDEVGISVKLHIVSYESGGVCSGGDDVGLTGASISAQYRVTRRLKEQRITGEWTLLAEINPTTGFSGVLKLPSLESSVAGVQLRLLQLEHGGGGCNCWRVEEALLMWGRSNRIILQQTHCSTISPSQTLFCGDNASSPREFISETVQQKSEEGLSFMECANPHVEKMPFDFSKRIRRSSHDNRINVSLNLASLSEAEAGGVCYGGHTAGLGRTTLRLEHRSQLAGGAYEVQWTQVEGMDDIPLNSSDITFSIPPATTETAQQCVQFRLVQEEHGGVYCNCWSVQNIEVQNSAGTVTRSNTETMQMCLTRASVRRILMCTYCNNTSDNSIACTTMQTNSDPPLRTPFNISVSSDPPLQILSNACSDTTPRLHIFFQVIYQGNCDRIENDPDEAIEFSISFDDKIWIPITVIHGDGMQRRVPLGDFTNLVIRDYQVESQVLVPDVPPNNRDVSLELCNFVRVPQFIQFRWLQTSFAGINSMTVRDFWGLDDLRISYIEENGEEIVVLSDSFDDELNSTIWPIEGRRDARVSTMCTGRNQTLTLGLNTANYGAPAYFSRSIRTAPILTGFLPTDATTTQQDEMATTPADTDTTTMSSFTVQAAQSPIQMATSLVLDTITNNSELTEVTNVNLMEAVDLLSNLTARAEPPDPAVSLYLLGDILNRFNSTVEGNEDQEVLVQSFLEIGENIITNMPTNQCH